MVDAFARLRAPDRRPGSGWAVASAVVAVLAVSNVVVNRFLPRALYVPWNLSVALGILALAVRWDGQPRAALGLSPGFVRRGLRVGGLVVALVVIAELVALLLPVTRDLFRDRRVGDVAGAALLYEAFVRIPLGTVVLEETAFRAVLPAVLGSRLGRLRGALAASALFGLWHVLPAWNINTTNPVYEDLLGGSLGRTASVAVAVTGTGLAGMGFWWLRVRSNSLLSPMLAHGALNSTGYLLAWGVQHR